MMIMDEDLWRWAAVIATTAIATTPIVTTATANTTSGTGRGSLIAWTISIFIYALTGKLVEVIKDDDAEYRAYR